MPEIMRLAFKYKLRPTRKQTAKPHTRVKPVLNADI